MTIDIHQSIDIRITETPEGKFSYSAQQLNEFGSSLAPIAEGEANTAREANVKLNEGLRAFPLDLVAPPVEVIFTPEQRAAIASAADLNAGDDLADHNVEYVRGQAELICNHFGIDTESKEVVIRAILAKPFKIGDSVIATDGSVGVVSWINGPEAVTVELESGFSVQFAPEQLTPADEA